MTEKEILKELKRLEKAAKNEKDLSYSEIMFLQYHRNLVLKYFYENARFCELSEAEEED